MVKTGIIDFFLKTGMDRRRRSVALKKKRILA
jgi:hypothetical protein